MSISEVTGKIYLYDRPATIIMSIQNTSLAAKDFQSKIRLSNYGRLRTKFSTKSATHHLRPSLEIPEGWDENLDNDLVSAAEDYMVPDHLPNGGRDITFTLLAIPEQNDHRFRGLILDRTLNYKQILSLQNAISGICNEYVKDEFLVKIIKTVQTSINDIEFNVNILAKKMFMSRTQLYRKIKDRTGESPQTFILKIRMNKAAELLVYTDMTLYSIALDIGFSSPSHFSRAFRKHFQETPTAFRKGHK